MRNLKVVKTSEEKVVSVLFRMKTKLILLLCLAQVLTVRSVDFDCIFVESMWPALANTYSCYVENATNLDVLEVTSVNGNHQEGRTNLDVAGFEWSPHLYVVNSIPTNFDVFLPNLQGFRLMYARLPSVSPSDLKQFPNLKLLSLARNNLTILHEDLLVSMPQLQWIQFSENPLRNISQNLLEKLDDLAFADFVLCDCISFLAMMPHQLLELPGLFAENCPYEPPPASTTEIIPTTSDIPDDECSSACLDIINDLHNKNEILRERLGNSEIIAEKRFAEIERQLSELIDPSEPYKKL